MSAQKQCPKCGEKNPAEAVMCWACYTSLSGGAAAATAGGPAPGGKTAAMSDSGEKKKIEPKQMAIIGVGLLIALGVGAKTMLGGGGGDDSGEMLPTAPNKPSPNSTMGSPSTTTTTTTTTGNQPGFATAPDAPKNGPDVGPRIPYQMVVAPNPSFASATVAIVPTQNNVGEGEAKGLAEFAHHNLDRVKKFKTVEIYVFNNPNDVQDLIAFQGPRRSAPLTPDLYPQLTGVLSKATVRYYSANGQARYSSPMRNPGSFWKSVGAPAG